MTSQWLVCLVYTRSQNQKGQSPQHISKNPIIDAKEEINLTHKLHALWELMKDLVVAGYDSVDFHIKACGKGWRRFRTRSFRSRVYSPSDFRYSPMPWHTMMLFSPLGRYGCLF
ncbi:hypothetical protein GBA52_009195 [Prunus armeniaca]|nr:hypothetical protein GBA52_009195 [Prunus armeniaca]